MKIEHDFAGALDKYVEVVLNGDALISGFIESKDYQAIQTALRLADRLQQEDFCDDVLLAMHDGPLMANDHEMGDEQREWLNEMCQAMAQQLLNEVSDE